MKPRHLTPALLFALCMLAASPLPLEVGGDGASKPVGADDAPQPVVDDVSPQVGVDDGASQEEPAVGSPDAPDAERDPDPSSAGPKGDAGPDPQALAERVTREARRLERSHAAEAASTRRALEARADERRLRAAVRSRLIEALGGESAGMTLEVEGDAVRVGGVVDSHDDKGRALSTVRQTEGVGSLVDELVVEG